MKKFLGITLSVCMLLSMTACGEKNVNSEDKGSSETKVSVEEKIDTTASAEEKAETAKTASDDEHEYPYVTKSMGLPAVVEVYKHSEDLSDWGSYGFVLTDKETIYVKFPSLIPTAGDYYAYQNDGTVAGVMDASCDTLSEKITDEESIVELVISDNADFASVFSQMEWYLGRTKVSDINIELEEKEMVTVGKYDCCKGKGTLDYVSKKTDEKVVLNFVIYGSFSDIGTPFYWIVFDESEDQSLGDIVAQDAERMGYTIAVDAK